MKQYREKMEKIQPSAGLEETVLARARARGSTPDRRIRPAKLGAVLVAAALCIALCVGVGASAIYRWQSSVFIPGVGITDVVVEGSESLEDMQIWVLDEVVPLGDKQVDYVVLAPTGDGYELRVIVTRGAEDTNENYSMYQWLEAEDGTRTRVRNSHFGTLTAVFADGSTTEVAAISGNGENELDRLDTYIGADFPMQPAFTLRTPQGDEAAISLVAYDEKTHIVEKSNDLLTVRMFPLAKGSRYVLVDGTTPLLGEGWEKPDVYLVAPIDENGTKLKPSMNVDIDLGYDYGEGEFETLIFLKEVPQSRIVDCSLDHVWISSNRLYKVDTIVALSEPMPGEGERTTFTEWLTLFEQDGVSIIMTGISVKNGLPVLYMRQGGLLENGMSVSLVSSRFYLRTQDGKYYSPGHGSSRGEGEMMSLTHEMWLVEEPEMIKELDAIYGERYGIYFSNITARAEIKNSQ